MSKGVVYVFERKILHIIIHSLILQDVNAIGDIGPFKLVEASA